MTRTALVSLIAASLMVAGPAIAQEYTFVPLDVDCPATSAASECPAGLAPGQVAAQTSAKGINASGDIVGSYSAGGRTHGFLFSGGRYTSLDFPLPGVRGTSANGINPRGEIVGQYTLPVRLTDDDGNDLPEDSPLYCPEDLAPNQANPACIKGFHYWNGRFSTVMFPGHPGAIAQRITPDGDIYGCVHDENLGPSMFGAAWTRSGTFSLHASGGQLSDQDDEFPMSMNNGATPGGGTIVGFFMDMMSNVQRGYLVRNGMLEAYDPTSTTALTAIWDINPGQQFVGTFREGGEANNRRHAFLQNPDDPEPVIFDFMCQEPAGCAGAPLGTVAVATSAIGINPDGIVVGQYVLPGSTALHGFIAVPQGLN